MKCQVAGLQLDLPPSWADITLDLPEGSPPTFARADGVGALQFSVMRYKSGEAPRFDAAALEALLSKFENAQGLRSAAETEVVQDSPTVVAGCYTREDELVRVWYVSNGLDLALATFLVVADDWHSHVAEALEAASIVCSVRFQAL